MKVQARRRLGGLTRHVDGVPLSRSIPSPKTRLALRERRRVVGLLGVSSPPVKALKGQDKRRDERVRAQRRAGPGPLAEERVL